MSSLEDRIGDPEFEFWIKSVLSIDYAKQGIQGYVENKIRVLHLQMCPTAPFKCTSCTFETCNRCPAQSCSSLKTEISKHHRYKPCFKNTNVKDCLSSHWEMAKCYMSPGYEDKHTVLETDFSGIISVIINHREFEQDIADLGQSNNLFIKARQLRNQVMHSSNFTMDQSSFHDNCNVLMKMMAKVPVDLSVYISRTQQLQQGTIPVSTVDANLATKAALIALKKREDEIQRSITEITGIHKQILIEESKNGVKVLSDIISKGKEEIDDTVNAGVDKIQRETEKGTQIIHEKTEEGTSKITAKVDEGRDEIETAAGEAQDLLQKKQQETETVIKDTTEKAQVAITEQTKKGEDEVKQTTEGAKKDIDSAKEELQGVIEDIVKQRETEQNLVENATLHFEMLDNRTFENVKTLQKVSQACLDRLSNETAKYGRIIQDFNFSLEKDNSREVGKIYTRIDVLEQSIVDLQTREIQRSPFNYITVKRVTDNECLITGLIKLDQDRIALADNANCSVKILNISQHKITCSLKLTAQPWDITKVDQKYIVVSCGDELQCIPIQDYISTVDKKIKLNGMARGVEYHDEKFIVAIVLPEHMITMISRNGEAIRSFPLGSILCPLYVTVSQLENTVYIYVTDHTGNKVVRLNSNDGSHLEFVDDKLKCTYGLVTDTKSNIYVSGWKSDNILQISAECKPVQVLLDATRGLKGPQAMTYCPTENKLYFTEGFPNNNTVFYYKMM